MHLQGKHCLLRQHQESDISAMLQHFNIPEVYQKLRTPVPFTGEDAVKRMQSPHLFVIDVDGAYAGEVGVHSVKPEHMAELFYSLSPGYWGRGVMSEAVRMMSDWAFQEFRLIRLQAFVYHTNPASARVLEKCGFEKEGCMRQETLRLGNLLDRIIYAKLR